MASTAIYGVSFDSRGRAATEADNSYTLNLSRPMDRVQSIQLGSFQVQDSRPAFGVDDYLQVSEPVVISPQAFIRFREATTIYHKATRTQRIEQRTITLYLPPTLNKIVAVDGATNEIQTASNHGLLFAINFYPEIGQRARVVGGHFPQDVHAFTTPAFPVDCDGPLCTRETIQAPGFHVNQTTFRFADQYLHQLTGGTTPVDLPRRFCQGTDYHSYVYCPPPTLAELFIMLNAAVRYLNDRADLSGDLVMVTSTTPIRITTAESTQLSTGDEIVITGVTGPANGRWFITTTSTANTYQLDDSVGGGVYTGGGTWFTPQRLHLPVTFGFDNASNKIGITAPDRITDTQETRTSIRVRLETPLFDLYPSPLDPPLKLALPVQRVRLRKGTFDGVQVAADTTLRLNPASLSVEDAAERTLHYSLPSGVSAQLVLLYGCYTVTQLTAYLNFHLQLPPAQIHVTYAQSRFTFTHTRGLVFALNFESSPLLGRRLGFDPHVYSGASSYTSPFPAVYSSALPTNAYSVSADTAVQKFTFQAHAAAPFYVQHGTTALTGASWTPQVFDGEGYAHRLAPGEVLLAERPRFSSTQAGSKRIVDASNTVPIVVTTGANHGLVTGDTITIQRVQGNGNANGTWPITVLTPTSFELDASSGDGAYRVNTGLWWSDVAGGMRTMVSQVVVSDVWDASSGAPQLRLAPTASMFAALAEDVPYRVPLGVPMVTDGLILLRAYRRPVFMLHLQHPSDSPPTFGFPPMSWPPSRKTILDGTAHQILKMPGYNPELLGMPVANVYTSPLAWNLTPPPYMIMVAKAHNASTDQQSHSYRGTSFPIFAKLLMNNSYVRISEEMKFTQLSGTGRFHNFGVEFQNPDGTLVDFNGRPHNLTMLFSVVEDRATEPCV